jgi:hypothetical protein
MRARDNLFSADRVLQVRYRLEGITWEELLRRLERLGYRAAIAGEEGTGKTTLLEELGARLDARQGRARLVRVEGGRLPRLGAVGAGEILLVDGAERLPWHAWLGLRVRTRRAAGLVITVRRPGRLPTLIRTATSLSLLDSIVEELLGPEAAALRDTTRRLFTVHQGNLRAVLRDLYDLHAESEREAARASVVRPAADPVVAATPPS